MRPLVADHPIEAFLVVGNAVAWAFAVSPLADAEIWLERPLYASLGTIFGVALAAFLVTAVAGAPPSSTSCAGRGNDRLKTHRLMSPPRQSGRR